MSKEKFCLEKILSVSFTDNYGEPTESTTKYVMYDPNYFFKISKDGMVTAKQAIADEGIKKLCAKDCKYG